MWIIFAISRVRASHYLWPLHIWHHHRPLHSQVHYLIIISYLANKLVPFYATYHAGIIPSPHRVGLYVIIIVMWSQRNRFKFPVTWPDYVTVGTRVEDIQTDRITLRHLSISHQHNRVVAEGDDTCVVYDYRTFSKALLPDDLRHIFQTMFYHPPTPKKDHTAKK